VFSSGLSRIAMSRWPVVSGLWPRRSAMIRTSSLTMRLASSLNMSVARGQRGSTN
jgi:hypothetical protein